MHLIMVFWLLLLASQLATIAVAQTPDYLAEPERFWQRSLGVFLPSDGNSVTLSNDESVLYVTTNDGKLFALNPNTGRLLNEAITPKISALDWGIESTSGVALAEDTDIVVYAIVDQPPSDDYTSRKQTRIVAVDHDASKVLWTSPPLEGEAAGTPVMSRDGKRVMFTRNSLPPPDAPTSVPTTSSPTGQPVTTSPTSSPTTGPTTNAPTLAPTVSPVVQGGNNSSTRSLQQEKGQSVSYFTVLNSANGGVLLDEPSTDLLKTHLYSPVAVAHNVTSERFEGAILGADIVVWHTIDSSDGGGETQLFQYDPAGSNSTTSTIQLSSSDWMTKTAPTVSSSGNLFVGTSDGSLHGWIGDRSFELVSNFDVALQGGEIPSTQAVLSNDEKFLFFATEDNSFHAVSVAEEKVIWSIPSSDASLAATKAVLSPDGSRVYISIGSKLYAKEAATGEDVWGPVDNADGIPVQADFSVSQDGRFLYYIGLRENIVTALKLANAIAPTTAPSSSPTLGPTVSPAPTSEPTMMPTKSPSTVSLEPTLQPAVPKKVRSKKFIAILAGSVAGGVVALGLVAAGFWWLLGRRGGGSDAIELTYDFSKARPTETQGASPAETTSTVQRPKRYSYDPTRV